MLIDPKIPSSGLSSSRPVGNAMMVVGAGQKTRSGAFAQALGQVRQGMSGNTGPSQIRTVNRGDTLIGLVRQQANSHGVTLGPAQEFRIAQRIAQENGIENPNCILPGQQVAVNLLPSELNGSVAAAPLSVQAGSTPKPVPVKNIADSTVAINDSNKDSGVHPVLEKTLDRAVAKGFIPSQDKAAVYEKILQLASNHRFNPDDFARMTLMESDGMNPRASNQRCHGIIQFCDGPARGAASAGYAANPRAILELSVQKQLGLVDKYFEEVGLKSKGSNGLEDLYLSVLRPASRSETQGAQALNIPGPQSSYLHVGGDTREPITRLSIRQGLLQNAAERLGQLLAPATSRQQVLRSNERNGNAS